MFGVICLYKEIFTIYKKNILGEVGYQNSVKPLGEKRNLLNANRRKYEKRKS